MMVQICVAFFASFVLVLEAYTKGTRPLTTYRDKIVPHHASTTKTAESSDDLEWKLSKFAFSLLPLAPGDRRKTLFSEIVPNRIWTLDQIQGIVNVNVPVRSTIVKLKEGGLFVYNPVAPTKECLRYMKDLEEKHGPVKYIVLGSLGLEHKAFVGSFYNSFKGATIYYQPGQWSFPVNLPNFIFGFPLGKTKVIPDISSAPWAADFDHRILGPLKFKSVGGFGETAFFHYESKTLIVTDAVIKVGETPPPILEEDPRALLYHSRDDMTDNVQDSKEARLRGWRRMALFSLIFFPSGISVKGVFETFNKLKNVSAYERQLGQGAIPINGGLYPWSWTTSEVKNFKKLTGGLLVAPILSELILNREPERVTQWIDEVSAWPFTRIIPSHFENDIKANGKQLKSAFAFLDKTLASSSSKKTRSIFRNIFSGHQRPKVDDDDLNLLKQVSDVFTTLGIVAPKEI